MFFVDFGPQCLCHDNTADTPSKVKQKLTALGHDGTWAQPPPLGVKRAPSAQISTPSVAVLTSLSAHHSTISREESICTSRYLLSL